MAGETWPDVSEIEADRGRDSWPRLAVTGARDTIKAKDRTSALLCMKFPIRAVKASVGREGKVYTGGGVGLGVAC